MFETGAQDVQWMGKRSPSDSPRGPSSPGSLSFQVGSESPSTEGPLPEHFGGRCCLQAKAVACSCAFLWVCPSHGEQHIGTHD